MRLPLNLRLLITTMEEVSAEQRNDQKSARSGDKVSQMEDGRPMQWESASALQETCLPLAESGNWQVRNPDRNGKALFHPFFSRDVASVRTQLPHFTE
jgi:hypothetical protein